MNNMHLITVVVLLVSGLIIVLGRHRKPQGLELETDPADPFKTDSHDAFQLIEEVLDVTVFLFPHEVDVLNALEQSPGGMPIMRIASGVLKEKQERRIPVAFMDKLTLFLDLIDAFNLPMEDLSIGAAALLESLVTGYTLTLQIDEQQIVPINKQDLLDALFAIITETLPVNVPGNVLLFSPQLQLETIVNEAEFNDNDTILSYKEALSAALSSLSIGNSPIVDNISDELKEKQSQFESIIADPFNHAVSYSTVDKWFQLLDEGFASYKDSEAFLHGPGAGFIMDIIKDIIERKKTALSSLSPATANLLQEKSALLKALIGKFALPAADDTAIGAFIRKLAAQKLVFLKTLIEAVILSAANSPDHIVFDGVLANRKVFLHALFALVTGESASRADRKLLKTRSRLVALIANAAGSDADPALNYKEALFVALVALFDGDGILMSEGYIGVLLEPKKSLFSTVLERIGGGLLGTLTATGGIMSGVTVMPDGVGIITVQAQ